MRLPSLPPANGSESLRSNDLTVIDRFHAPYLLSRPALASARVIRCLASNWPSPPRMQVLSLNAELPSGRQQLETSSVGTGCQLWLFRAARRAVVAGDDQHVRLQSFDPRDDRVEFLDPLHLRFEVAVLAGAVGVLEMQEEEVVVLPVLRPASSACSVSVWALPTSVMPTSRASPLYIG